MKLTKLLKATTILGIFLISNLIATETVMKKAVEATETACEDPCQSKNKIRIFLFIKLFSNFSLPESSLPIEIPRYSRL
jgi:hypothetical protein